MVGEWLQRSLVALVLLGALTGLSGCQVGSKDEASTPNSETLDELRDFSRRYYPIYWLGDSPRSAASRVSSFLRPRGARYVSTASGVAC
jgi:hypothetical protein